MPVDYSRFDRLVAEYEGEEELNCPPRERLPQAVYQLRGEQQSEPSHKGQLRHQPGGGCRQAGPAAVGSDSRGASHTAVSERFAHRPENGAFQPRHDSDQPHDDLVPVDVDVFFKPARKTEVPKDFREQREDHVGCQARDGARFAPEEILARIQHLEVDRRELVALAKVSDRPAVRARISEFVFDIDKELALLREDPLDLDDEDRQALRHFQLSKMQLPDASHIRSDFAPEVSDTPSLLGHEVDTASVDQPWQDITVFCIDLGQCGEPIVRVDVRLEAVGRLHPDAVTCKFTEDSFDLCIDHTLEGRRYRLRRTCLQRDIDAVRSAHNVKRNHVIVSLAKVKEAGSSTPPPWTELCVPDRRLRNPPPWLVPHKSAPSCPPVASASPAVAPSSIARPGSVEQALPLPWDDVRRQAGQAPQRVPSSSVALPAAAAAAADAAAASVAAAAAAAAAAASATAVAQDCRPHPVMLAAPALAGRPAVAWDVEAAEIVD